MLFRFENEDLFKEYFNLSQRDVLNPDEGLMIGNMFMDEYVPYKDYKPSQIKIVSEKDRLLNMIRELSFAVNDLNLKLDLDKDNLKLYELFKKYSLDLEKCVKLYEDKYEVLEVCDDTKGKYTWDSKWPWEGMNV